MERDGVRRQPAHLREGRTSLRAQDTSACLGRQPSRQSTPRPHTHRPAELVVSAHSVLQALEGHKRVSQRPARIGEHLGVCQRAKPAARRVRQGRCWLLEPAPASVAAQGGGGTRPRGAPLTTTHGPCPPPGQLHTQRLRGGRGKQVPQPEARGGLVAVASGPGGCCWGSIPGCSRAGRRRLLGRPLRRLLAPHALPLVLRRAGGGLVATRRKHDARTFWRAHAMHASHRVRHARWFLRAVRPGVCASGHALNCCWAQFERARCF